MTLVVRTKQRFLACRGEPIERLSTRVHSQPFGKPGVPPLTTAGGGVRATHILNTEFPVRLPWLTSSSRYGAADCRSPQYSRSRWPLLRAATAMWGKRYVSFQHTRHMSYAQHARR